MERPASRCTLDDVRTHAEVGKEMVDVVADARAAAAENDDTSYDLDHTRLNDLLAEWQSIPQQRTPTP